MHRTMIGLALASTLALTACGTGQIGDGVDTRSDSLALITGMRGEPFYVSIECAAKEQAAKAGVELTAQAPEQFEQAEQARILNSTVGAQPGAIIIAPTDDKALATPLQQAKNNGIEIVEVDTALQDRSIAKATLSSDNYSGGQLAARTLADLVDGKEGSVLALNTKAGTSTTDARAQGFEDEIARHDNLSLLPTQYTKNEPATAAEIVSATLSAHRDLVGVFGTNLNTGEGAATALANADKSGEVALVGFDASPKQVEDLRTGRVQALIAQDPATIGSEGVNKAIAALEGKPVERETKTDMIALTQDNMREKSQYFYKSRC